MDVSFPTIQNPLETVQRDRTGQADVLPTQIKERLLDPLAVPSHDIGSTVHTGVLTDAMHGSRGAIENAHSHNDLSGILPNQHHNQIHNIDSTDHADLTSSAKADGFSIVWDATSSKHIYREIVSYTDEKAQDAVGNAVGAGLSYNDSTGAISSTITQYTDELAQDAVGNNLADTDTINMTYTDSTPEIKADVKYQMSITADSSGIKLSGDSASPGNSKYYGTNGSGTLGFHDLP
jgi:hypothetical protein